MTVLFVDTLHFYNLSSFWTRIIHIVIDLYDSNIS